MTTEDHLDAILAKCNELLTWNTGAIYTDAALRSTIAAIEGLRDKKVWNERVGEYFVPQSAQNIIAAILAAWPEHCLAAEDTFSPIYESEEAWPHATWRMADRQDAHEARYTP